MKEWEINAFIAQALNEKYQTDIEMIRDIKITWIDPKCVHVASLFMRGVGMMLTTLAVCNFPFPIEKVGPL